MNRKSFVTKTMFAEELNARYIIIAGINGFASTANVWRKQINAKTASILASRIFVLN